MAEVEIFCVVETKGKLLFVLIWIIGWRADILICSRMVGSTMCFIGTYGEVYHAYR